MEKTPEQEEKQEAFLKEYKQKLSDFISSGEEKLPLPPMTSNSRRLIHNIVAELALHSYSSGEGDTRHIIVVKKEEDIPKEIKEQNKKKQAIWSFGKEEFFLDQDQKGEIEVFLDEKGNVGLKEFAPEGTKFITTKTISTPSFRIDKNEIIPIV